MCVLEVRHSHFIEVTEHLLSCLETNVELTVDSSELQVLGMFAKLRNVTVSFIICLSVCSLVLMEQLGSHWTYFHKIYFIHFCKICGEHSVS
jgi:hypothetical protein